MSVGDVNSTAKGSGARYNDGKPDYSLIPLHILAEALRPQLPDSVYSAIRSVGNFQMGGEQHLLYDAMTALNDYLDDCAYVFEYGKRKYAAWNWSKGQAWSIPIACIGRHARKIAKGELLDVESERSHEGHILCNIVMLIYFFDHYKEGDDRPEQEQSHAE